MFFKTCRSRNPLFHAMPTFCWDLVDSLVSQLLEGSSSGPLNGGVWLTPMISHESLSVFWHTEDGKITWGGQLCVYIDIYTYKAKSWDFSTKIIWTLCWIMFLVWTCVYHCNTFEYNHSQAFLPSFHLAMFLHEGSGHQVEMMLDPNQAPLHAFGRYFFERFTCNYT